MTAISDLNKKAIKPDVLAELAIEDEKLLDALLQGISPDVQKAVLRENSSKALVFMAEQWPETLLPHWSYFIGLLKSDNGFSKVVAIRVITFLIPVDTTGLFDKAFNVFFNLLDDKSVMVASHTAGLSGKIAKAKPSLQSRITKRLLDIDKTHFDPGRQGLIKSYIIEALDQYFAESKNKTEIIAFVKQQVNCASPKTRKMAKTFLEKWKGSV